MEGVGKGGGVEVVGGGCVKEVRAEGEGEWRR